MIPTCICKLIQMQIVISHDLSFSGLNTFPGLQLDPRKHNRLHSPTSSERLGCCRPLKNQASPKQQHQSATHLGNTMLGRQFGIVVWLLFLTSEDRPLS